MEAGREMGAMSKKSDYRLQTRASESQAIARQELVELFGSCPVPTDQLLANLHLYMRSSVLAKIFYVNELYQQIVRVPGVVMEFGVWWGGGTLCCLSR